MIDAHTHYLRPEWLDALWPVAARQTSAVWPRLSLRQGLLADPGALLHAMDARGVARSVIYPELSIAPGPQIPGGQPAALKLTRAMNDSTAALVARYPHRLIGLAVANPLGTVDDLAEVRRAIVALGLRGVAIGASYAGVGVDAPAAQAFLTLITALDVPLVIHPTAAQAWPGPRDYGLDLLLGVPHDLTLTAVRLLIAGRLAEYPRLRVVLPHLGGGLLALLGWLDAQTSDAGPRPGIRAQRLYVDTATASPAALALAIASVGLDHVLFGTDWPLSAPPQPGDPLTDPAAMIAELPLEPAEQTALLAGNALALFGA